MQELPVCVRNVRPDVDEELPRAVAEFGGQRFELLSLAWSENDLRHGPIIGNENEPTQGLSGTKSARREISPLRVRARSSGRVEVHRSLKSR